MTLYATVLWLYVVMASVVLGAGVYESFVVHPAWSRKPPESFVSFVGTPIGRMNIAAFWAPVTPFYALSGLGALVVALSAGSPPVPLTVSVACAVLVVVWTLVYFRPNIHLFLDLGGGNTPAERLQSEARRWVLLNWIRVALTAVSWCGALRAAVRHG
jgi:hypothetical protein